MFLKSLTLKGFKSFADATTLEFQPGLTVVVGPNGSGKSNLVDAVAWVLGAQGPRTLRSARMEDVVFAGAANRAPLGRAEVSLTIDNSARVLPLDLSEVTITRTLFRNDESEYALNGAPCRLLDVQELLSDAGVGRHQHVIVSQGHLDAVLEGRPEGRRTLIEEAAGVHKYRRRREKAERRLVATEDDLVRLQDLLREVRRQLRSLERQADAARRHRELDEERRALRLHVSGRELAEHEQGLAAAAAERAEIAARQATLEEQAAYLEEEVSAAEAAGAPTHDADDVLVRFERLLGRVRGTAALLAERRRAVQRQLGDDVEDRLAALQGEHTALEAELEQVEAQAAALGPEAEELEAAEAAASAERAALDREAEGERSDASRQAAEARGALTALQASLARSRSELGRLQELGTSLERRDVALAKELSQLGDEVAGAEAETQAAADRAAAAQHHRAGAEEEVGRAKTEAEQAEQRRRAWETRVEALESVLEQDALAARRLAATQGAVGTLASLVEVDEGWEAAFEAAVPDASSTAVLDTLAAARQALATARGDVRGATLLPLGGLPAPTAGAPRPADAATATSGHHRLRSHVRALTLGVDGLLDVLLAQVVVVDGWEEGVELVLDDPDVVAVTPDGDRFSARGWRVGPSSVFTKAALDEARSRAEGARADLAGAEERLAASRSRLHESDAAASAAVEERTRCQARHRELLRAVEALEAERRSVAAEAQSAGAHRDGLAARVATEEARVAELAGALPSLEAQEAAGVEQALALRSARDHLDERLAAVATLRTALEVRAAALEERRGLLSRRLHEVRRQLVGHDEAREAAVRRRAHLEGTAQVLGRLESAVAERASVLETRLGQLHRDRERAKDAARTAADRLAILREERAARARELAELRERARQVELHEAGLRLRVEATTDVLGRELGCGRDDAVAAPCPELPPGTSPADRLVDLDDQLRRLGPVNALALEDHEALDERHRFLEGQLNDVKRARQELAKLINAVDAEIAEVFAAAFADVSENFAKLFAALFPGGSARLRLTDPDDLLGTGIEVEARPSGKRVGKLSLLSGGERSLTALAFLFAVFRSRPSPFYLLDEVEAALDDVNLNRFLELVNEFRDEAQLVVVSHQKRTMEAADCLYGVTLQPGGSSMVVSERLRSTATAS